ncbi:MAG: DUF4249 domain-containing protein [Bacteroidales bacterium]|nr:DUF4249 domain-containing protein [Bacteroidales bacterium]
MRKIFYLLLVQCLFLACEEEAGLVDDGAEASRLVINALCTTADSIHRIGIYRTGITSAKQVPSAKVTLSVNGQEVADGVSDNFGQCRLNAKLAAGDEVSIRVTDGEDEASATTIIPQPLTVVGCDTLHIRKRTSFDSDRTEPYIRFLIRVRLADGARETQFFRLVLNREACSYQAGTGWDVDRDTIVERIFIYEVFDHIYSSPGKYEYDFDPALSENSMKNESEEGIEWFDGVANDYGLFRSSYFDHGEYTLCIDVEDVLGYYPYGRGHKDICTFRIHSISKAEYDYLWAAAALVNTYEAGVLLSNPPIVPSNVAGGTGIFGVSSEAVLHHEDVEKILRDDIIQIWPKE